LATGFCQKNLAFARKNNFFARVGEGCSPLARMPMLLTCCLLSAIKWTYF